MVCTFFGHRECYSLDKEVLKRAIQDLIRQGIDDFWVGHQGHFDRMVLGCLRALKDQYPHIHYSVVLAYLPAQKPEWDTPCNLSMYPDGLETGPPRFATKRRNRWMIDRADYCLCYVNHPRGGTYKFARLAKRRGLSVINLGSAEL